MVSVKKQLKRLEKRQDALERAVRNIKPKRLRKLVRKMRKSVRSSHLPVPLKRAAS
jgi:hypothetical protein